MSNWRENLDVWPRELLSVKIDITKTALMIVDMQLYDTSREYGLALAMKKFPEMYDYFYNRIDNLVIPNNIKLLKHFRDSKLPVIHITIGTQYRDGRDQVPHMRRRNKSLSLDTNGINNLYVGSEPQKIQPPLKPIQGELVVNKITAGAFNSTGIDLTLRNMGIEGLIITGVSTNGCVETTARGASDRGYECVLVEDACAAFDEEGHEATLKVFARFFGEVWKTEQVLTKFSKA